MLRGINERCACPVVLVGEEPLRKALESERRLKSRVRQVVVFEPVTLTDIAVFYQAAVGLHLDPEVLHALWQRSQGDFRLVKQDALEAVRIMNANRLTALTMDVVKALRERD
jgi:DNA transposition AAA+ family ATPase